MTTEVRHFNIGEREFAVISVPCRCLVAGDLTDAERDVVQLAVSGRSNAEIADVRGVSVRTVANQLAAVYGKLGVNSRSELASVLAVPM